jgi:hypothetical protein
VVVFLQDRRRPTLAIDHQVVVVDLEEALCGFLPETAL